MLASAFRSIEDVRFKVQGMWQYRDFCSARFPRWAYAALREREFERGERCMLKQRQKKNALAAFVQPDQKVSGRKS